MMQKYDSYKDSGMQWLGEIPSHWEVKRLASYFSERKVKVSDKDYEPLSVTKNGIFPQLENVAKTNDGDNRKLVLQGDFVINSRSDRKGSSGVSKYDGSVSLINIVLKPRKNVLPDYCNYILKGYAFVEEYYRNGRGIVADLWTTRFDEMKTIKICMPPLAEQQAIAAYLDEQTAKIDTAIAQQQKMIDLLNERKQIIINHAVTKGLNPNVKMKDSGVEWIGEMPEHWEVRRLKHIARLKSGDTINSDSLSDVGFPVYGGNGFRGYTDRYTNDGSYVLIGRQGALCGNVNYATGKFFASEHAVVVYPYDEENILWLGETIKASNLNQYSQSAAQPGLAVSVIENIAYPYPPKDERNQIANHLQHVKDRIDTSISNAAKQIALLQERKQIIINDVVTGKVKVC
ncbi:MAG: restriction endonuclease subunit S [Bacteroidales bacterium]|nr:restriction endonuclease subunit S [Bacteroidales bacterium]